MRGRHTAGDVIAGRYRLTEHIATGGMGEVWQADDEVLQRPVAVKLLTKGLKDTEGFDERFRSEARHSAQLHHHNIAAVHDFGENDDGAWLVMEYVPGLTVAQMIRDRGALPPDEVTDVMTQAARALGAAHSAGVVHRDVKPANIIVTPTGVAKLTDFGIARAVDSAGLTRTGEVMGTAQYLAPEQLMGRGATPASDLYSLGVVAHEMLTGERPYERESVVATAMAHVNEAVPPLPSSTPAPLSAVVMRLMAKDPADRPQTAREVVAMLTNPDAVAAAPRAVGPDPADQATRAMTTPVRRRSVATTQGHPVMTNLDRPTASGARRVPARRRGFPWAWFLAAAVIVGLLTAVVMMLLNGREDEPEGPVQTVTTTTDGGTSEESPSDSDASGSASESESDSGNSETATDPESSDDATTDPVVLPPTTSQDDPSTSEADPTTSDPEPTTSDPEPDPSTSEPDPTTSDPAPTTSDPEEPTTEPGPDPSTSEPDPTTSDPAPTTSDPEEPTTEPGPDPSISDPEPKPTTSEPAPTPTIIDPPDPTDPADPTGPTITWPSSTATPDPSDTTPVTDPTTTASSGPNPLPAQDLV